MAARLRPSAILRDMASSGSPPNPTNRSLYVQFGCGMFGPEEWTNFDASVTLKWERIPVLGRFTKNSQRYPDNVRVGNIVEGLPVPDQSCQGVYASHVLEHLTLEDFHKALENTYRMLRKDGIFRLVVPDLEWSAREYVARIDKGDPEANSLFLKETSLGLERQFRGLIAFSRKMLGDLNPHLWMWDEISLTKALRDHGFLRIRRCQFGDCEDPMFSFVENLGRFQNVVAMEARR